MSWNKAIAWWAVLVCLPALVLSIELGCDDTPTDGDGDGDGDSDGDGDGDGDADSGWTSQVVDTDGVGNFASIDVAPDGTVGVVYYAFDSYEDGLCEEVPLNPPPRARYPIYYSYLTSGATAWETETVAEPIHIAVPTGLSFRYSPDGTPAVAVFGGEPIDVLCSANDALYYTRTGPATWTFDTAATDGSTPTPPDVSEDVCPAAASTSGYCVGSWPALAFDSAGNPALMYRDTHFGGMQHDDDTRADAEMAYRQGGWQREVVDCGEGGGVNNALVFDSEDRVVAFHRIAIDSLIRPRHGLWAHRRETDGSWLRIMLATGLTEFQESSIVAGSSGYLAAIYYDPGHQHPFVAELDDTQRFADLASWGQEQLGDDRYNEGLYPSIALAPDGTLAVAYYRCTRSGDEGPCDPDHDALVFRWRTTSGAWRNEVVDEGSTGHCGTNLSLAIGPDNVAYIAYVCVRQGVGSEFIPELKVATRRPL